MLNTETWRSMALRHWSSSSTLWRLCFCCAGMCVLLVLYWLRMSQASALQQQTEVLTVARQKLSALSPAAGEEGEAEQLINHADFAARLPVAADVESTVAALQRAASAQGVKLLSVQSTQRVATESTLGRVEMQAQWRGGYPDVKAAIGAGLQNSSPPVVHRLSVRRVSDSSADVVVTADVWLLTRPLSLSVGR